MEIWITNRESSFVQKQKQMAQKMLLNGEVKECIH